MGRGGSSLRSLGLRLLRPLKQSFLFRLGALPVLAMSFNSNVAIWRSPVPEFFPTFTFSTSRSSKVSLGPDD